MIEIHREGLANSVRDTTQDPPSLAKSLLRRKRALRSAWWHGWVWGAICVSFLWLVVEAWGLI